MSNLSPELIEALIQDLCLELNFDQRVTRLLTRLQQSMDCGAIALLQVQNQVLKPLAQLGLSADVMGRRFTISDHPRFAHLFDSKNIVRFAADSQLPDPYDGMLPSHQGDLPVHACMAFPIKLEQNIQAVLTLDSLQPGQFDHYSDANLNTLNALATATYKLGMLNQQVAQHQHHAQEIISELNKEVLLRDGGLVGESTAIRAVKTEISLVAKSDLTVLIEGETGVGKELIARMIHQQSSRAAEPLVYLNCAAIPENLVESELFGHIKGSFTGADRDRAGKFTLAHMGTLFLDEIGELPLSTQSKLLRVLQNQEIQRVGKDDVEQVDVRIIAATNRELEVEVAEGRFRADLYHRLSVYPIAVPPLRRRSGDILLLAGYFTENLRRKLGIQQLLIDPTAITKLENYHWPGNVRELEHVISRAALRAQTGKARRIIRILPEHIETLQEHVEVNTEPQANPTPEPIESSNLKEATDLFQRQLIVKTLTEQDCNWSAAARQLKVDRSNLVRLAKRLNITMEKRINE